MIRITLGDTESLLLWVGLLLMAAGVGISLVVRAFAYFYAKKHGGA